jgi:hypothetical protein
MEDILRDIQEEFGASSVALANYHEVTRRNRAIASHPSLPSDESINLDLIGVGQGLVFTSSGSHGVPSPSSTSEAALASTRRRKSLSLSLESEEFVSTTVQNIDSHRYPSNPNFRPNLYERNGKDIVWYCGNCGDGPYGTWQISCQSCGNYGGR